MNASACSNISNDTNFDVMFAFSRLDTSRKMALFDHLMCNRPLAYRNTLHTIWPQASDADARKLEMLLRHRIQRLQAVA